MKCWEVKPVPYCWWTKSCTTKHDDYHIIYSVLTIPGGCLGFLPSTVSTSWICFWGDFLRSVPWQITIKQFFGSVWENMFLNFSKHRTSISKISVAHENYLWPLMILWLFILCLCFLGSERRVSSEVRMETWWNMMTTSFWLSYLAIQELGGKFHHFKIQWLCNFSGITS